jgi:type II secretory pathway pseudopilin PulG
MKTVSRRRSRRPARRVGFTILELEVAMVVFGIALMGVCPLVVMYSKQLRSIETRFNPQTTYYLVPVADHWTRKLGAAATMTTQAPPPTSPPVSPLPVNDVQVQSFDKSMTSQNVTVTVSVQPLP